MQASALEITVIDDVEGFRRVREEWNTLLQLSEQETIFLTWEWLFTWWEIFGGESKQLQILFLYNDSQLVGIAPLQIELRGYRRRRVLQFIGVGEPVHDQVVSEYLDVFAHPDWQDQVVDTVMGWMGAEQSWNRFECSDIKEGFLIWHIVGKLQSRFHGEISAKRRAYSVPLLAGSVYLDRLSDSRRKRLARSARALQAEGGLIHKSISSEADITASLSLLARLHSERWTTKNRQGVFESTDFSEFHLRVLKLLWPLGKAGIETFSIAEEPYAVLYCFYTDDVAYYYQSGFATADANKFMPLSHAHNHEIDRHTGLGRQYYDLMRGSSESYKQDFGCETVNLYRLYLFQTLLERRVFLLRVAVGSRMAALLSWLGIRRL